MLAAGEAAHEERNAIVAQLHVGAQLVAVVAALNGDRFAAGRLHVFEQDVLVVVLDSMIEFDLHEVAAVDRAEIGNFAAVVLFDVLADRLAAAAGDIDRFVGRRELVVLALDLQLQAGAADVVFEREVGEVAVPIQRAGAASCEARSCAARA